MFFSIDRAMHSLGYKTGYTLPKRYIINPIDYILVHAEKVWLDISDDQWSASVRILPSFCTLADIPDGLHSVCYGDHVLLICHNVRSTEHGYSVLVDQGMLHIRG